MNAVPFWPVQTQIVEQVGWTHDGQVLTISTTSGEVLSYLSTLPVVFDYHSSQVREGHVCVCVP